jgi:hypothetical protein
MICESMNITATTAHAQSAIACTRLLRNMGNLVDRVAYGGGFEDFLVGIARCMAASLGKLACLPAHRILSSGAFKEYESRSVLVVSQICGRDGTTGEKADVSSRIQAAETVVYGYGVPSFYL